MKEKEIQAAIDEASYRRTHVAASVAVRGKFAHVSMQELNSHGTDHTTAASSRVLTSTEIHYIGYCLRRELP